MSDIYVFGYSSTPQKHGFTLMLRCNGIAYEFMDPPFNNGYDYPYDYDGAVIIRIPKPQFKWQRKLVDRLVKEVMKWKQDFI